MIPEVLGCLILDENTGQPLYSHFFDDELKKNPSEVPARIRSKELKLIHEMGKHAVYSALVTHETPKVKEYLKTFKERVEKTYPDGLKRGSGNFADMVILRNIVTEVFGNDQ
ncbi:hypothetical protein EU538_11775 [Candidatus Thorarchaeota archaeon]|nr:MAG: hypothetical protein EU538_11775 [Candidatus Thorarchaeota archaeon]